MEKGASNIWEIQVIHNNINSYCEHMRPWPSNLNHLDHFDLNHLRSTTLTLLPNYLAFTTFTI